ncbi:hypothetical protein Zmor_014434 [Zophobas morio]|uniref:Tc1-like transposase DDE domain-containing protein n=1 Tax=Zophobas morio TaxID=2755281 RepID=A0AA38MGV8_9CUCU|nr:hypothetical protein Zmor_014434 [Zophobas morio]
MGTIYRLMRHVHRSMGVMAWRAIAYGSRLLLIFIRGNMTAARYIDDLLWPGLLPNIESLQNDLFQQDNARLRIAHRTMHFLEDAAIDILPWPPRSPDFNPIEYGCVHECIQHGGRPAHN